MSKISEQKALEAYPIDIIPDDDTMGFTSSDRNEVIRLGYIQGYYQAMQDIEEGATEFAKSYMEDVNPSFEKVKESEELWKWKMSCLRGINKAYEQGKQDAKQNFLEKACDYLLDYIHETPKDIEQFKNYIQNEM